jgi:hypothetical protein
MRHEFEPRLQPVEIVDLRPTQMTVGMREVYRKRQEWRDLSRGEDAEFLGGHMLPAVRGPKGRFWIVDHHHLALALHKEGVRRVLVSLLADLRDIGRDEFLTFMDNRNWLHPFDRAGERRPVKELPKHIWDIVDDPFRSLAGSVRQAGGFAKEATPYAEFLWADFLRRRLKAPETDDEFDDAAEKALKLARSRQARHLPGWVSGGA